MRPNDLAKELGVTGLKLRNWLRDTYPRSSSEHHTRWFLTPDQAGAARAHFGSGRSMATPMAPPEVQEYPRVEIGPFRTVRPYPPDGNDKSFEVTLGLYRLLASRPRLSFSSRGGLSSNGIYLFFERGETISTEDGVVDRVVRVGTHTVDGRLPGRIADHFGPVTPRTETSYGNKNASAFRRHLGSAVLRRQYPADPRLAKWMAQKGRSYTEVEQEVTRRLREEFTFTWIAVPNAAERLALERGLIALLAQRPLGRPSAEWVGAHAANENVRRSGLWNSDHVDGHPLTAQELKRLEVLAGLAG